MVSRTAETQDVKDIKYYGYGVYTVIMSSGDTFTASDFVDTENLKVATLLKNNDGTTLTTSILDNIVTLTTVGIVDQECTLFIFGVRT